MFLLLVGCQYVQNSFAVYLGTEYVSLKSSPVFPLFNVLNQVVLVDHQLYLSNCLNAGAVKYRAFQFVAVVKPKFYDLRFKMRIEARATKSVLAIFQEFYPHLLVIVVLVAYPAVIHRSFSSFVHISNGQRPCINEFLFLLWRTSLQVFCLTIRKIVTRLIRVHLI